MRASGRSTLLMTRITGSPAASVLRSTNLVCGSGPSLASTSSRTPSTMDRPRSTSPPKSAWPGVSTMLMVSPPWCTAVFLARIVMPFSRSRSPESSTRSATFALARNAPDCQSIASTSVVLPWSTCATIATLRRSSRVASRVALVMVVSCGAGMAILSRSFGVGNRATRVRGRATTMSWPPPFYCLARGRSVSPANGMPGVRSARDQARDERLPGATGISGRVQGRGQGACGAGAGGPGEAYLLAGEVDGLAKLGETGALRDRRPGLAAVRGQVEDRAERLLRACRDEHAVRRGEERDLRVLAPAGRQRQQLPGLAPIPGVEQGWGARCGRCHGQEPGTAGELRPGQGRRAVHRAEDGRRQRQGLGGPAG